MPMLELLYRASSVHRMFFDPTEVQQCTLLSIKTGGCTEDCGYCSQSVRHKTFVKPTPQMKVTTGVGSGCIQHALIAWGIAWPFNESVD